MKRSQWLAIAFVLALTVGLGLLIARPLFDKDGDDHSGHDHGSPTKAATTAKTATKGDTRTEAKAATQATGAGEPARVAPGPKPAAAAAHGHDHDHDHDDGHDESGSATKSAHASTQTQAATSLIALTDAQIKAAGIRTATAAPGSVATSVSLPGEIRLDEDRTAHVVPRVAGVVERVDALLGQSVKKGQILAVLASSTVAEQRAGLDAAQRRLELARSTHAREKSLWEEKISAEQDYLQAHTALQEAEIAVAAARQKLTAIGIPPTPAGGNRFELRAPFGGVVLEKHVTLGEAVREDTNMYTISDLSTVWANFNVAAGDLATVRLGARAVVHAPSLAADSVGTVSYVGSLIGENTRTATSRVTVPNPQGAWRPGLFVNVSLVADQRQAAVTVPDGALQTVDGRPSVFVRKPGGFEPRVVEPGLINGRQIEIRKGLAAGEEVAVTQTFVLKSELEKDAAEHTH